MKNETQYDLDKTRKPITIEKLQEDMKKLQNEVRRLEIQVAAVSNVSVGDTTRGVEVGASPQPATTKLQMCKSCKHMRLPHKSNPHYACGLRHENIEPRWTCEQYSDKNKQRLAEPAAYCGH